MSDWLSGAPLTVGILNLWRDFRKVVGFNEDNKEWMMPLLNQLELAL